MAGTAKQRQIIAMGGGGFSEEPDNPLLDLFILGCAQKSRPILKMFSQVF